MPKVLHRGVVKERKCRDFIFIIFFALYWVGMFVVCATAVRNGNPQTLIIPKDYLGNYCGVNNPSNSSGNNSYANQEGASFLYYINPFNLNGTNATFICINSCPKNTSIISDLSKVPCRYDTRPKSSLELATAVSSDICAPYEYSSTPVLYRCVPNETIDPSLFNTTVSANSTDVQVSSIINSGRAYSQLYVADLFTTWPLLLFCAFSAVVLSFIWLYIAKYVVSPFVWASIFLFNITAIAGVIILYLYYKSRNDAFKTGTSASGSFNFTVPGTSYSATPSYGFLNTSVQITQNDVNVSLGIFVTWLIITILIVLITIFMIKRVKLAMEIINEASMAFKSLPGIQFVPVLFSLAQMALFAYFVVIMLYIWSPQPPLTISLIGKTYTDADASYYMFWYHLTGFIWTFFTLVGLSQMTVAGAVAEWYWTMDKKKALGHAPVLSSMYRAVRYHLGSVILGSFLITIVELIRIILYNLQKRIAKSQITYLKYIVACAQCCMKCVEVLLKWINKHAYVYIAISGSAFFSAAGSATALLIRNAAKTVAVGVVSDIVLVFTKLFVVGINTIGAYYFMVYNPTAFKQRVYDPTVTVIFVAVITYMVANVFFANYQLAIDTIFLSALEDLDKNDGSAAKPYFASDRLLKIMNKKNKTEKKVNQL